MERRGGNSLVEDASARRSGGRLKSYHLILLGLQGVSGTCDGGGGGLSVSAGAPATAAAHGRITECGNPVSGAEVILRVRQNQPEQARPVRADLGPVTTDSDGRYSRDINPSFAVPGSATVQLRVKARGLTFENAATQLELSLGSPPRDTVRLDADLGAHRGSCS